MTDRSIFTKHQFPSYFFDEGPELLNFIQHYYEWMELEGNTIDVSKKLKEYRDVDTVPEDFFKFMKYEFMQNIPENILADKTVLLKNIKDFYRTKGSERSYEILFKVLFNEEVEFYYPGRDILRASDGKWVVNSYVIADILVPESNFSNVCFVTGSATGSRGRVEKYIKTVENGVPVTKIYLKVVYGRFQKNEDAICVLSGGAVFRTNSDQIEEDGFYASTDGFLSSDKRLQDNFYYQEYSYVVKVNAPVNSYRKVVTDLAHPAGTKFFGELQITPSLDSRSLISCDSQLGIQSEYKINNTFTDIAYELTIGAQVFGKSFNFDLDARPRFTFSGYNIKSGKIESITASEAVSLDPTLSGVSDYQVLRGLSTTFTGSFSNGDFIFIYDMNRGSSSIVRIEEVISNTLLKLYDPYIYGTLNNSRFSKPTFTRRFISGTYASNTSSIIGVNSNFTSYFNENDRIYLYTTGGTFVSENTIETLTDTIINLVSPIASNTYSISYETNDIDNSETLFDYAPQVRVVTGIFSGIPAPLSNSSIQSLELLIDSQELLLEKIQNINVSDFYDARFIVSPANNNFIENTHPGDIAEIIDNVNGNNYNIISLPVSNRHLLVRDEYPYGNTHNLSITIYPIVADTIIDSEL